MVTMEFTVSEMWMLRDAVEFYSAEFSFEGETFQQRYARLLERIVTAGDEAWSAPGPEDEE